MWIDSNQFEINVDEPTLPPALPDEVELENLVRTEDTDGISSDDGDQITWTP